MFFLFNIFVSQREVEFSVTSGAGAPSVLFASQDTTTTQPQHQPHDATNATQPQQEQGQQGQLQQQPLQQPEDDSIMGVDTNTVESDGGNSDDDFDVREAESATVRCHFILYWIVHGCVRVYVFVCLCVCVCACVCYCIVRSVTQASLALLGFVPSGD